MKQYKYLMILTAGLLFLSVSLFVSAKTKVIYNNETAENTNIALSDEESDYNTGEDSEVHDEGIPNEEPGENVDQGNEGDKSTGEEEE